MKNNLLVSIITVSYNSEKTIADTIESVINQDYDNIEYILVDGKSKDSTLDIINRYSKNNSKIKFKIISEEDNGLYDAMNKGIKLASGDVIGIINSDDMYNDKNVISDVVKTFNDSSSDAIYSDLVFVDENDTTKVVRKWISKKGDFNKGWMPPHPTLFLKAELYKKYGYFNIKYKIAADYDLMYRILKANSSKMAYLSRTTIKMRMGGESTNGVNSNISANKEVLEVLKSHNVKMPQFVVFMKIFRKIPQLILK